MFKARGLVVALALVCFAIMAFNSNSVLADDAVELETLTKVKQIKRILNRKVLPLLGSVPQAGSVSRTGQTTCYGLMGAVIDCAGTGQDGEYQKGTPWPIPRFTDNGNGTVTDNMTGLIWLKSANCFSLRNWLGAVSYCNGLADPDCGLTDGSVAGDWRLPNHNELQSLVNLSRYDPSIDTGYFPGTFSDRYWSSTTYAGYTENAWVVNFYDGSVGNDSALELYYVRAVRGGQ